MRKATPKRKRRQDKLCKALTEVDYQVYNITGLANDIMKFQQKSLTRALWVKFAKNYVKHISHLDKAGMKDLSQAYQKWRKP